jgi:acetyltransferase-like isoleucine patch superfamily enzyme
MKVVRRILSYYRLLVELNILKTVFFNFKVFPISTAIKLPVFFFGPVRFASLKGTVIMEAEVVTRGMVQFGCKEENIITTREPTRISLNGKLVFNGKSKFGYAIQLLVWDNGVLTFGNKSWLGSFSKIVAFRSIEIGKNFLASWECQVFDTDFHFIENTDEGTIADTNGIILIGDNVWLGSRVTVLKNTVIPSNCIIALGSICNKDYSGSCPPGSVIGGIPAKFLKKGVKYIDDKQLEKKLFKHFQQPKYFGSTINRNQF